MAHFWKCGRSVSEMWWLIGWRCGGSLALCYGSLAGDVVAQRVHVESSFNKCADSLLEMMRLIVGR